MDSSLCYILLQSKYHRLRNASKSEASLSEGRGTALAVVRVSKVVRESKSDCAVEDPPLAISSTAQSSKPLQPTFDTPPVTLRVPAPLWEGASSQSHAQQKMNRFLKFPGTRTRNASFRSSPYTHRARVHPSCHRRRRRLRRARRASTCDERLAGRRGGARFRANAHCTAAPMPQMASRRRS